MGDRPKFGTIRSLSDSIPSPWFAGHPAASSSRPNPGSSRAFAGLGPGRTLSSAPSAPAVVLETPAAHELFCAEKRLTTYCRLAAREEVQTATACVPANSLDALVVRLAHGQSLPNELWTNILMYMTRRSAALSCTRVSKRLYALIAHNNVVQDHYCDTLQCGVRNVDVSKQYSKISVNPSLRILMCSPSSLSCVLSRPSTTCHGFFVQVYERERTYHLSTIEEINESLMTGAKMHQLSLQQIPIGHFYVSGFVGGIAQNGSVRSLELSSNRIDATSISPFVEMLKTNTTLRSLSFSKQSFGDDGAIQLAQVIKTNVNTTLRSISIVDCSLTPRGVRSILEAVVTNTTLRSLDIRGAALGKVSMVGETDPQLENYLVQFLGRNKTLRHIGLENCYLTDECMDNIMLALNRNTTLRSIDLSNNMDIGPVFIDALLHNTTLTSINLSGRIDPKHYLYYQVVLRYNKTLRHINLSDSRWSTCDERRCKVLDTGNLKNIDVIINPYG